MGQILTLTLTLTQTLTLTLTLTLTSEGCELDTKGSIAMVTILNDDAVKNRATSVLETRLNRDKFQSGMAEWKKQFQDAIKPGAEDDEPPGPPQYAIHAITVIFKVRGRETEAHPCP